MIVCNLTKPESTLDQVKKTYPKLQQTDAALIAIAIVLSGRASKALYDDQEYAWPDDYEKLTQAVARQVVQVHESLEAPTSKRAAKAAAEEEPVEITYELTSNLNEGDRVLGEREDLKTLLAEIFDDGVEYQYSATDIGWQWALERANWQTLGQVEFHRRIKLRGEFRGSATGVEIGATGIKKRRKKAAAPAATHDEPEVEADGDTEE